MIVEDLLWWDSVAEIGLAENDCGDALHGGGHLLGARLCDLWFVGAINAMGMIFELGKTFPSKSLLRSCDVAVIVVRGISFLGCQPTNQIVTGWQVEYSDSNWECGISVDGNQGLIRIVGACASIFRGIATNLPEDDGLVDPQDPSQMWSSTTWSSDFVLTSEPRHVNGKLMEGYAWGRGEVCQGDGESDTPSAAR